MSIESERTHDGGVLRITLSRPKANILDAAMIGAITAALDTVDHGVKAVVFDHAGPHFSFGASVEEHQKEQAAAMLEGFHALFRKLAALSVPTVALVRGRCLGGGLELASWCTWIFAADNAQLGQPEIRLAVFPPMASLVLPWRLGLGPAMDLCVSGRVVAAHEAQRIGLVNAVVEDPAAHFDAFYAENLASGSAAALRFAERAVRASLYDALETRLPALERLYLDELMETHDANEGIRAFMAKERPAFRDA